MVWVVVVWVTYTTLASLWWKNNCDTSWPLYGCRIDRWCWKKKKLCIHCSESFTSCCQPLCNLTGKILEKSLLCASQTCTYGSPCHFATMCNAWELCAKVRVVSLCLVFDVACTWRLLLCLGDMHLFSWLCWCTFEIKVFQIYENYNCTKNETREQSGQDDRSMIALSTSFSCAVIIFLNVLRTSPPSYASRVFQIALVLCRHCSMQHRETWQQGLRDVRMATQLK